MKNKSKLAKLLVLSLVPIALVLMVSVRLGEAQAPGVTFVVNSTADVVDAAPGNGSCATAANVCTLRAAIQEANALAGADIITLPAGTYALSIPGVNEDFNVTGDLDIGSDLTITGAGANMTTIDAGGIDRVLEIRWENKPNVTISGLRVTGGKTLSTQPGGGSGGGILTQGALLTLTNVTVSGNTAGNQGGGIFKAGPLTLNSCTVSNNTAGYEPGTPGGGGIMDYINGTLTLNNSTISSNSSPFGGGIGSSNYGLYILMTNSTVSNNTGGGLRVRAGTVTMKNIIMANGSFNCSFYGVGSSVLNSLGHNLSTDNSCASNSIFIPGIVSGGLNQQTDLNNTPAQLAPLELNLPGSTKTHALCTGPGTPHPSCGAVPSPAIDNGNDCLAMDQRGVPRPQGKGCDIGAYEVGSAPSAAVCASRPSDMVAWWPLDGLNSDGEYDDLAGGDNNGTPFGNPSQISNQYVGNSLQSGISDGVLVSPATNLNFGAGPFSIDAWVKPWRADQIEPIVAKQRGYNSGYFLFLSLGKLYFQSGSLVLAGPPVTPNQWNFVAVVVSPPNVILYAGTSPGSLNMVSHVATINATNNEPLSIDHSPFNPHSYGVIIDEVEIFNRALTHKPELQSIFDAGSLGKCKPTCLTPPPSGMVAWWPLDEKQGSQVVQDLAGGHHGTPMNFGGAVTTIGASGGPMAVTGYYVANSLLFDGAYVEVPDSPDLNFGEDPFTIDAWVKHYPLAQTRPIVSKRASPNGAGYFLSIEPAGAGVFNLTLQIDGVKYTGPAVPNSTWAFVAATRNASGVTLYVGYNNTLTKLTVTGSPEDASSAGSPLRIGQSQPAHPHTHSEIDEVEIFNRALDELEVEGLFRADWAGKCKTKAGKGTVIIRKNTAGGNDTFGYTTDGAGLTAFNITTSGGTGSQIFTNIASGPWTVTEASPPSGWVFTSLVCSDPYGGTTVSGQTANLDIESDETVICTYTNTKCPAITLNPAPGAFPAIAINTPYRQTFSATGGCSSSFNYSVTSGALPNGLTLGADGVLSGTATQAGSYDFTVTATDSCGCSQSQTYTLTANVRRGDFSFRRGMNEYCIWGGAGGGYNSQTPIDNPYAGTVNNAFRPSNSRVRFSSIGLCYGRILLVNDMFAFKYAFNANPVAVLSYREVNRDLGIPISGSETRRNVFGAGLSPLGLQLYFRPQSRVKPFVNASGGFIFFKDQVPRLNGSRFNFSYDFGGGVQVFRDSRRAFNFGYKHQRISSGGRALNNPGFNAHIFYFGYSIFKAPKIAQTDDLDVKRKN